MQQPVIVRQIMRSLKFVTASAAFILGGLIAPAALAAETGTDEGLISIVPSEIKWADAPSVGPGAQLAVLEGDLKQAGPLTFRLKLPPNFTIPLHTHPLLERVTVLSGTFHLGVGETVDKAKARAYPPGGVTMIPAGMPMFAYTSNEETIVQIHGTGPWGISYLDSAAAGKK
ncbi:cupin domain-containing protein [Azoarcus sp. PA01]|nr:cupin domain-containing protein [Azoarcus sp. PA01]